MLRINQLMFKIDTLMFKIDQLILKKINFNVKQTFFVGIPGNYDTVIKLFIDLINQSINVIYN